MGLLMVSKCFFTGCRTVNALTLYGDEQCDLLRGLLANEKKLLESLAVFHELLVLILFATWKPVEWALAQQLSKIYRNLYLIL